MLPSGEETGGREAAASSACATTTSARSLWQRLPSPRPDSGPAAAAPLAAAGSRDRVGGSPRQQQSPRSRRWRSGSDRQPSSSPPPLTWGSSWPARPPDATDPHQAVELEALDGWMHRRRCAGGCGPTYSRRKLRDPGRGGVSLGAVRSRLCGSPNCRSRMRRRCACRWSSHVFAACFLLSLMLITCVLKMQIRILAADNLTLHLLQNSNGIRLLPFTLLELYVSSFFLLV